MEETLCFLFYGPQQHLKLGSDQEKLPSNVRMWSHNSKWGETIAEQSATSGASPSHGGYCSN